MKIPLLALFILCVSATAHAQQVEYILDQTPNICANFYDANGVSIDPTGTPTLDIYEESETIENVNDLPLAKFDGKTGLYCVKPTLSAANGFEVGKRYMAVISCDATNACNADGRVVTSYVKQTFVVTVGAGPLPSGPAKTRLQPSVTTKKATTFQWGLNFVASDNDGQPGGVGRIPACTRSTDAPLSSGTGLSTAAATLNTPSVINALGLSELTLTASEVNGNHYVWLRCTAAGADTYLILIKIQGP